jgi:VWFA-related protein
MILSAAFEKEGGSHSSFLSLLLQVCSLAIAIHRSHRMCKRCQNRLLAVALALCTAVPFLVAQQTGGPAQSQPAAGAEIAEQEQGTTFKVKVNLVLVRVVVRDAQGRALGNLRQESFQLFDDRKPQVISKFSVERPGSLTASADVGEPVEAEQLAPERPRDIPEHYIAFLFDDIHLQTPELIRSRDAADRQLRSLLPSDRAAVFTTSGQTMLDFTDDAAKLHTALLQLRSRPIAAHEIDSCPDVSYYMADLIQNKNDPVALQVATKDALECAFGGDSRSVRAAQSLAQATALRELAAGEQETRVSLGTLDGIVHRLSGAPGQRTLILVSPGFLNVQDLQAESDIIDRATRANVVINGLDARGLYAVLPGGDASQHGSAGGAAAVGYKVQYQTAEASTDADIMANLAYGTGGTFFHNSNDLQSGLDRLASVPEYFYVLGFAPQNLKYDGHFHKLKVTVTDRNLSVQARQGYFAPKHVADPAEQAKREIEDAMFSQEVMQELPVQLHTQFFKSSDTDAKLSVLARIDVKQLHFQKVDGRNKNNLTVVSGIFDRNGNFVVGSEKVLQMRLKDDTLANKLSSGITMRTSFDLKPGSYLVRLVVRDDAGLMAAQNGAVEIP